MNKEAVFHKINSEFAYPVSKHELLLRIRVKKNDVKEIKAIYFDKYMYIRGIKEKKSKKMEKMASCELFDYYECILTLDMISVIYCFEIIGIGDKKAYYGNYTFFEKLPVGDSNFFIMPYLFEKEIFHTPKWAEESIVYQIFVERFCNGNPSISPEGAIPWESDVSYRTMLGGDVQGMIDKLDYIYELGINVIYLTPVFQSSSNHKYNTFDYYKIDPHFGTEELVKEFVEKAHRKGIKIIFDAVFNHSGHDFFAFQDVMENGKESKYVDWYDVRHFPVKMKKRPDYATFGYSEYMPKLMTKNEEVVNYFIDVALYWIKACDIDGWRLDVANEIDHHFWRKFREEVRAVKEDFLIVGEVWHESSSWLKGDQFDSVMNYPFMEGIVKYIAENKITPSQFADKIGFIVGNYKKEAINCLWNLIDSHDTPRFLHLCKESKTKMKLAAAIQMTFPGMPMMYYGDEVGMTGGRDPDCRRGMLWGERQDKDMLEYYKKIIWLRRNNKALTKGNFTFKVTDDEKNILWYTREFEKDKIEVIVNNSTKKQSINITSNKKRIVDLLTDESYKVENGEVVVDIKGKSVFIFK